MLNFIEYERKLYSISKYKFIKFYINSKSKLEKKLEKVDYMLQANNGIPPSATQDFTVHVYCKYTVLFDDLCHSFIYRL